MNFGLLNIVVGVFVENSISEAAADAEHKLNIKKHAFHRLGGERPAGVRPTGAAGAKKGRIVGGIGCPPNCRTSGKLRGSSGKLGEAPTLSNFLERWH